MEILGYLLLGTIGIAVTVYLFYLCRAAIAIIAFLLALYLFFFKDSLLAACIVVSGWYMLNCVMDKMVRTFSGTEENTLPKMKSRGKVAISSHKSMRKKESSRMNWNYILMWIIPLFWPVLIFRTFFGDKQVGELNAYDYEQHLRSNGK